MRFGGEVINLISSIHEAKGRQEAYLSKKPKELERLVEIAKVQSTEASNAIEEKTAPRNRAEEEISGYRDALRTIHENFEYIQLTPNYILQLHKILFSHIRGANFGGVYKNTQNYIQGIDGDGNPYAIFTPLTPYETKRGHG